MTYQIPQVIRGGSRDVDRVVYVGTVVGALVIARIVAASLGLHLGS